MSPTAPSIAPASSPCFVRGELCVCNEAFGLIEGARALVVCTPVYKASYTGVLKIFLDALPQFALTKKVVLPLVTGGPLTQALVIDYALRPVLMSLGAPNVLSGVFLADGFVERLDNGELRLESSLARRLDVALDEFAAHLRVAVTNNIPEDSDSRRSQ